MGDESQGKEVIAGETPISRRYTAGIAVMNADKALFGANPQDLLDRLGAGETASQLAGKLGIGLPALYQWLLRNCPEQWASMSAGLALSRIDKAESTLDDETLGDSPKRDSVIVSRARSQAAIAQWSLERVARKMYGDTKGNGEVNVTVVIDRSCGGTVIIPEDSGS